MEGNLIFWGWLIAALVVLAGFIFIFNSLVRKRNYAESAWSNIDVQLKRRYDLIPNLVETVKAYATHEKETFARITELRAGFQAAKSPEAMGEIDRQMNVALKHLFAVAENYPDLKASQNYLMLQEELAGTENRIAYSRNNYNMAVMSYNTGMETFPGNLVAGLFRFRTKEFFQAEGEGVRDSVRVDLG